jgi:hypothetical protein
MPVSVQLSFGIIIGLLASSLAWFPVEGLVFIALISGIAAFVRLSFYIITHR